LENDILGTILRPPYYLPFGSNSPEDQNKGILPGVEKEPKQEFRANLADL
jgi:hypothetical protein